MTSQTSPVQRVEAALSALAGISGLNALTHLCAAQARAEAERLTAAPARPDQPLWGMPIVVKANIEVAGQPFDAASAALRGNVGRHDAPVVARLRAAGAIVVGIANMHELAFGITSANAAYGAVANPLDPRRMAGGSSGGTAAAIGAGAVPAGLASDTGGSGRLPAAMCGCVGFRPGVGRYPDQGLLTLSHTLDTVAPMGRDVTTVALLDAVLAARPRGIDAGTARPLRLGIVRDPYWNGLSAKMSRAGNAVLNRLRELGVTLVDCSVPRLGELSDMAGFPIALHETLENWHRQALELSGHPLDRFVRDIASPDVRGHFEGMLRGELPPRPDYDRAMGQARPALQAAVTDLFRENRLDSMVSPTLVADPPLLGDTNEIVINGVARPLFPALTARALVASVASLPALSMPVTARSDTIPLSFEIVGAPGMEQRVLEVGLTLERLLDLAS